MTCFTIQKKSFFEYREEQGHITSGKNINCDELLEKHGFAMLDDVKYLVEEYNIKIILAVPYRIGLGSIRSNMTKYFELKLSIPLYEGHGMKYTWFDESEIKVELLDSSTVRILANQDGLKSLAAQLLTLAQDSVTRGEHLHLDDLFGGLEEGSSELILERA